MKKYNLPVVVAINRFVSDTERELEFIDKHCKAQDVPVALCEVWAKGGRRWNGTCSRNFSST